LALHEAITQSLAGRTAILKLLLFSIQELSQNEVTYTLDLVYAGEQTQPISDFQLINFRQSGLIHS
jgi:hypothetical protein